MTQAKKLLVYSEVPSQNVILRGVALSWLNVLIWHFRFDCLTLQQLLLFAHRFSFFSQLCLFCFYFCFSNGWMDDYWWKEQYGVCSLWAFLLKTFWTKNCPSVTMFFPPPQWLVCSIVLWAETWKPWPTKENAFFSPSFLSFPLFLQLCALPLS